MFRSGLLRLSHSPLARRWADSRAANLAARRFVAGPTLADALAAVERLQGNGLFATLDHLGENVTRPDEAEAACRAYGELITRLAASSLAANASLKLTQLGLHLDPAACLGRLRRIAHQALDRHMFLRIDMEDSSAVDPTLAICRSLRAEGLSNLGVVIQAYLHRAEADLTLLLREGFHIRLVKGAYQEPPSISLRRKADIDANYDRLARTMLRYVLEARVPSTISDGRVPPIVAFATHDHRLIGRAQQFAQEIGLPRQAFEFQMLHGIRSDLQISLAAQGYPTRVYVPYGTEWFPYLMRRLAERPANLWLLARNALP